MIRGQTSVVVSQRPLVRSNKSGQRSGQDCRSGIEGQTGNQRLKVNAKIRVFAIMNMYE